MKKVLLFTTLLFVTCFAIFFFTKDMLIGTLLEKYAVRRCNKLSGEVCKIESREQIGQKLTLNSIQLGNIASADEIVVAWNYHLGLPLVTFDVVVNNLQGDAKSLPLYAVWNLIKEDGKRRALCLNSWKFENTILQTSKGKVKINGLLAAEPAAKADIEALLEHNGQIQAHIQDRKLNFSLDNVSIEQAMALAESWSVIKWPMQDFFLEGVGELDLQTKDYQGSYKSLNITLPNPKYSGNLTGQFKGNAGHVFFSGELINHMDKISYQLDHTFKNQAKAEFKGEQVHLEKWLPSAPFQWEALADIKGELSGNTLIADVSMKSMNLKQEAPQLEFSADNHAIKQCMLCWDLSSHQLQGHMDLENGKLSGVDISALCTLNGSTCLLSNVQFGSSNEMNLTDILLSSAINSRLKLDPDTKILLQIHSHGVDISGALKGSFYDGSWNDYLKKAKGQFQIDLKDYTFEIRKMEGKLPIGKITGSKARGKWTKDAAFSIEELEGYKAPLMAIHLAKTPFQIDFKTRAIEGVFLIQGLTGKPFQLSLSGEWKKPTIKIESMHADHAH